MGNFKDIVYIDWTLVFTWVNFFILFFILKHFLYNPVKKMLDKRKEEVEKTYSDADSAKKEAQTLKAEYETQMSTAKEQANEIIATATNRAKEQANEIVTEAREKSVAMKERAAEQIELDKRKAMSEIKDKIADLAICAAGEVVKKEIDAKENENLINDFLDNVGEL